jgi:hypothetical protein
MKLVKTIPHLGGLPEIFVFYCSRCKQAETKKQAVKCEGLGAGWPRALGRSGVAVSRAW